MMKLTKNPRRAEWDTLLQRPQAGYEDIAAATQRIMQEVRDEGDAALLRMAARYDRAALSSLVVADEEWASANELAPELSDAIELAAANISKFHKRQEEELRIIETMPGIRCWRKAVGIGKVGLYIPGGTAPLFSTLLMLGIPARLAGCAEIVVCTPPRSDGSLHPAILFAAKLLGIEQLYKAGGAGAIAAMAYGTESIPRTDKIFGPGNRFVTCAKLQLSASGFAIDMPAGPSELAVLADESCIPSFVAADLLSQAEHGEDSQVLLVSDSMSVIDGVQLELRRQLPALPRKEIAAQALSGSKAFLVSDISEGMALLNAYAPEHLIIACRDAEALAEKVVNAGSVFLGNYAPESVGDYASGTNHALPTGGAARAFSGISVESFQKNISFQHLSQKGLAGIAKAVESMALAEGLQAHASAVGIRLKSQKSSDENI